ncbi:MAG: decaprenyl-phosphate phosphoribosyltransferase [Dehalococcoidia bacterium]
MRNSPPKPEIESIAIAAPGSPRREPEFRALIRALRPKQWLKNGTVFLAFVFSIRQAWQPFHPDTWLPLVGRSALAVVAFSLVASAEYLVNDLRDVDADRLHPRKRLRPLAAGTLRPHVALVTAVLFAGIGLSVGGLLSWPFGLVLLAYASTSLAYSYALKHLVIVDVLTVAVGFVLRAVGGAVVIGVPVSPWLYLCTILGALFIAITRRRHEMSLLGDGRGAHRPILDEYSPELLEQMTSVVTAATVVSYSLYTVEATNLPSNHAMLATVPFVLYGVFRYLLLVDTREHGGSPEEVLLRDRPLLIDIGLWLLSAAAILVIFR